jgi:5-oxoprolinase (ATP-hydrolysing) subunit A
MVTVDLVADVGESFGDYRIGDDDALIPALSSANVACGFHAGDPRTMQAAVAACVAHGVALGAHPGFPDLVGFGRRGMDLTAEEIRTDVLYQVGALAAFAQAAGTRVAHLSPHGRLANLAVTERRYAEGIAAAVEAYDPAMVLLTQPGELADIAEARGLRVGVLGMADRAYEDDGQLVPRDQPGAVLRDPQEIVEAGLRMAIERCVISRHGNRVNLPCDSLILHGDNPASIAAAHELRAALEREGVTVAPVAPGPRDPALSR